MNTPQAVRDELTLFGPIDDLDQLINRCRDTARLSRNPTVEQRLAAYLLDVLTEARANADLVIERLAVKEAERRTYEAAQEAGDDAAWEQPFPMRGAA